MGVIFFITLRNLALFYLQVVSLARDVSGGLLAGREADEDALPVRRVGLLRLLDHRLYHDAPKKIIFLHIMVKFSQSC